MVIDLSDAPLPNRDSAAKTCSRIGGFLPEPKTEEENNFLGTLPATHAFLLGTTDEAKENTWSHFPD